MAHPVRADGKTGIPHKEYLRHEFSHENTKRVSYPAQKGKQNMLSFVYRFYTKMIQAESERFSSANENEPKNILFY